MSMIVLSGDDSKKSYIKLKRDSSHFEILMVNFGMRLIKTGSFQFVLS